MQEFLKKLAECRGHISVDNGVVSFEDGTTVNVVELSNTLSMPTVVVEIEGGLVNSVTSNQPARVIVLDDDTEGGSDENIKDVNGTEVYVLDYKLTKVSEDEFGYSDGLAPDHVQHVVDEISS